MIAATQALAAVLDDLAAVVDSLTDAQYAESAIPGVSGSVGGHVRHCLDHIRALEVAMTNGVVNYDARERDTLVEHDRTLAWSLLKSARRRIAVLPAAALSRPVVVRAMMRVDGAPVEVLSSLEREVAFVIAHTIHHCATIAVLAGVSAEHLPERFGLAPSTPGDMRAVCAR